MTKSFVNKNTNWDCFRIEIEEKTNLRISLRTPIDIEKAVDSFNTLLQEAAFNSTTLIKSKRGHFYCPIEVKELLKEKRKLRKKWQISRFPEDKTQLNHVTNQLKKTLKETKQRSIAEYLKELTNNKDTNYSLWKTTKNLKNPKIQIPPLKAGNEKWARSDIEKAELFSKHLEDTFMPNEGEIEEFEEVEKEDNIEIRMINLRELQEEIRGINSNKAPGYDWITGKMIQELPKEGLLLLLLFILNAIIRVKHVPSQWKMAEVIMIPKPGKQPTEKSSYRPISLLPILSKIFEKLLLKRLNPIIEERRLIPTHQFGFRCRHSTIDQVHRITSFIENALEKKEFCSAVFLDVAQAFDKVWHEGLKYKLKRDLPKPFFEILNSYLSDRHFRIKYGTEYSTIRKICAGVPQGSVLGPILYLLYTRDIPQSDIAEIGTFADDTAILASGERIETATRKLQITVNEISKWTKKWRIKLNETKSVNVIFTNRKTSRIPIMINNKQIPYANSAKYLGMNLDAKLRWKEHIKKKVKEISIKYKKMYWLLGRNSELSIYNKLLLYKQIIKPVWIYGIQLWGCATKTNINKIQILQNKILRNIVNAPWYVKNVNIHRDLKISTIEEEIKKVASKHLERIQQHVNIEARKIYQQNLVQRRRLKRKRPNDLI